jgi:hypothetical protein
MRKKKKRTYESVVTLFIIWSYKYLFQGQNTHLTAHQIHSSTTQHQNHNRIKKKKQEHFFDKKKSQSKDQN